MIIIYVLNLVKYVFMCVQFAIFRKLVLAALKRDKNVLSDSLGDILMKVAKKLDIQDYEVKIDPENTEGREIIFLELINKTSGSSESIIIKKAFSNEALGDPVPIRCKFLNEINFYSNILPILQNFAQEIGIEVFDCVPKCHLMSSEEGREYLVLDNPKYQGFEMLDKKKIVTYEHMEIIYKVYAKLHATSILLRLKRPEDYKKIISNVFPIMDQFSINEQMSEMFCDICKICTEKWIPEIDDAVIRDFQKYVRSCVELFADSALCKGDNPVFCYGNCWSSNMMFKYNEDGQIEDIKIMNWQFTKLGAAVSDVSYSLYSEASKESFDRLEDLLSAYDETFSSIFQQIGEDTEKIFPLSIIKEEWKRWTTYAMIMNIISLLGKTTADSDLVDRTDMGENDLDQETTNKMFDGTKSEEFNTRFRELLMHCHEMECL